MEHHIDMFKLRTVWSSGERVAASEGIWGSLEDMEVLGDEITLGRDNRGKKRSRAET